VVLVVHIFFDTALLTICAHRWILPKGEALMWGWMVVLLWMAPLYGAKDARTGPAYVASLAHVKPECTPETLGVCIKKRCQGRPMFLEEKLKKRLPDDMIADWQKVFDAIVAVHEVILYAAETMDAEAFASILSYPIDLCLSQEDNENVWERWTLRTPEEVKKIFPYIMNPLVRRHIFDDLSCDVIFMNTTFAYFFFFPEKFLFYVKRLTLGHDLGYKYSVVIEDLYVTSSNYLDDIGHIRRELSRPGDQCRPPRQCAQPRPQRSKRRSNMLPRDVLSWSNLDAVKKDLAQNSKK
jgi:hypothetical protein